MTMMAAVLMSATAFAQDEKQCNCNCKCKDKKPDKTEMVKHRTDRMVKEYGLDEAQAQKLLELNTGELRRMRDGETELLNAGIRCAPWVARIIMDPKAAQVVHPRQVPMARAIVQHPRRMVSAQSLPRMATTRPIASRWRKP